MSVLLPSVMVNVPRSSSTEPVVSHVVLSVATVDSCSKPMAPEPENVYEEVSSSDCRGKRKIKLQVVPE